jgi:hypothetical protein
MRDFFQMQPKWIVDLEFEAVCLFVVPSRDLPLCSTFSFSNDYKGCLLSNSQVGGGLQQQDSESEVVDSLFVCDMGAPSNVEYHDFGEASSSLSVDFEAMKPYYGRK